ncbi:MAG: MFS transporter, partial [Lachnospiraceae bacterium]|nr:MFS transporter [Lachnospiraceae bacterium]
MNQLFRRDYTMVVIGQIISLFGNAILRFALPLYLLRETNSSSLFGAVTACSFIPLVIFSLFGGVIADRKNKRNIMVALDFSTAAVILIFSLALGKIPLVPLMIAVLMVLYGISGIYQPAVQASIPFITQREMLMQGNAVINMVSTLAGLLGPIIGGVLFGAFGIMPILFISIFCFLISAVMEIFIHIPFQKNLDGKSIFQSVRSDLSESFQFVKNEKPIFLSVLWILA